MGCETLPLPLLCCYGDGGPPGVGLVGDEQLCGDQGGRGVIKDRGKQRDRQLDGLIDKRWSDT